MYVMVLVLSVMIVEYLDIMNYNKHNIDSLNI
jgi:hypothetical protein